MRKKLFKYIKFIVSMVLILGLVAPSYASLSASDGSAFVTKAEFDSALADFNSRLTTFEAGINSKIDSQVTSYLDRNGIWNGKVQDVLEEWCWFNPTDPSMLSKSDNPDYFNGLLLKNGNRVFPRCNRIMQVGTELKPSNYGQNLIIADADFTAVESCSKSGLCCAVVSWDSVVNNLSSSPFKNVNGLRQFIASGNQESNNPNNCTYSSYMVMDTSAAFIYLNEWTNEAGTAATFVWSKQISIADVLGFVIGYSSGAQASYFFVSKGNKIKLKIRYSAILPSANGKVVIGNKSSKITRTYPAYDNINATEGSTSVYRFEYMGPLFHLNSFSVY